MTDLVIVADDLTGAGDAAVGFAATTTVAVLTDPAGPWPVAAVLAVDTDSRYAAPATAATRVATTVTRTRKPTTREPHKPEDSEARDPRESGTGEARESGGGEARESGTREAREAGVTESGPWVYKKVDSLLRGNVAAEIRAAAGALGAPGGPALAVVAPAFPATGRTVRGGVLYVHGEPLPADARRTGDLSALLGGAGLRVRVVHQCTPETLEKARAAGIDAVVCDTETDADLAAVARSVYAVPFPVLPVGSAGLAAQITVPPRVSAAAVAPVGGRALVVIGSYAREARAQREALVAAGFVPVVCDPGRDVGEAGAALRAAVSGADVVLSPDPAAPVDRRRSAAVAGRLAALTAAAAPVAGLLVAAGGETARAVLTRLEARELWPVAQPEPGVVVSRVPGLRPTMVTKAGAFGDPMVLVRVIRALTGHPLGPARPSADDAAGRPPGPAERDVTDLTGPDGGN